MKEQLEKDGVEYSVSKGGANGYFSRTDAIEAMDNFYYDKWCHDKEDLAILFPEKRINWFREDRYSATNDQLIKALLTDSYCAQEFYSYDDYWEDEKYGNRPDMRLVHKIINSSKQKLNICDLACGHGDLIKKLTTDGHKVIGVDCNPVRIRHLQEAGLAAKCDSVESFSAEEKYDCVILLQVLEHVKDVLAVIEKVHALLKVNGSVFVAVPLGKNCDCDEHVRQLTENRLVNLFADGRWQLENMLRVPYQNSQMPNNILLQAVRL